MSTFSIYGLNIHSEISVESIRTPIQGPVDVFVFEKDEAVFSEIRTRAFERNPKKRDGDWFYSRILDDGSIYLLWTGLFEFWIAAAGREVFAREIKAGARESFESYFLSHVLSFVLLFRGREVTHCTVLQNDSASFGLMGPPGVGKSTLGGALLSSGHDLITDDLLVLRSEQRQWIPSMGPQRIKLFPKSADRVLSQYSSLGRMNPGTRKLIIPLSQEWRKPKPLRAIFVLERGNAIRVETLTPKESFLGLLKNTFNPVLGSQARMQSQFEFASQVSQEIAFYRLSYPRRFSKMSEVLSYVERTLR